ncbi:hypothetical protein [Methylopila sp. M107]|uniref:hypothetical protein n=1 Tax=Methylopila sp. M107 TaxID=1101190 RepID=UPI0003A7B761|nr:hypothetical protein [Methylopila sp. M107]
MPRFLVMASILGVLAPLPAFAADACAPIASAFEKLAAAPAYRQVIRAFGQKPVTSLAIGQKFYIQQDGQWQALQLKEGGRLDMMKAAVGVGLNDCQEKTPQTLDGAEVKVFAYSPPPAAQAEGAVPQTLWVGADGLPRRIFSTTAEVEINYDDVKAPPTARQAQ